MAASIYATPPPDLIGEDTRLSDSSSSSALVSSNNNNPTSQPTGLNDAGDPDHPPHQCETTGSTSSYFNSEYFDGSDAAKKRRKQTTPLRISADKDVDGGELGANPNEDSGCVENAAGSNGNKHDGDNSRESLAKRSPARENEADNLHLIDTNLLLQRKMDPGLLDNMDIVQKAALLISHLQKSKSTHEKPQDESQAEAPTDLTVTTTPTNEHEDEEENMESLKSQSQIANLKLLMSEIMENRDCAECGAKFDCSLKLKMHIFQEHGHAVMPQGQSTNDKAGEEFDLTTKLQMIASSQQQHQQQLVGKTEDWMSLAAAGLSFPFPPDAAGYLPQLPPLLGMPSQFVGGGSNMDSLSRPGPPLRIFNPEAYCDLCNKEFCNKYFLKTHRANKHGIYEQSSSTSDSSASNSASGPAPPISSASTIAHSSMPVSSANILPSQLQQQQQQQTMDTSSTSGGGGNGNSMPGNESSTVYCDICLKKFANTFAMKRHRLKAHESGVADKSDQQPMSTFQGNDGELRANPINFPEDFRPDFSVEQEDASFTPQPRKLSPISSQQARESNFSADKLRRLGVLNPEAFCELCCKEYCNKYFLRTHKLKRHGILMPPEEMRDVANAANAANAVAERSPWQFLQANPLNLMLSCGGGDFSPIQQLQQKFLSEMTELANRKPIKSPEITEDDTKSGKELDLRKFDAEKELDKNRDGESSPSHSPNMTTDQQADVDAISMDLQKLQSMILQLNDLNASHHQQQMIACHLCGKELENQYLYHAHLMAEHGHITDVASNLKPKSGSVSPTMPTSVAQTPYSQLQQQLLGGGGQSQSEFCKQCDKEFGTAHEFKQHLFNVHGITQRPGSVSPTREGFVTPDRPTLTGGATSMPATPTGDRRPPYTMTPTSSYCEICNKELCNKYFMKTHMQRMHGIEIENGSQIGGVVCNICNKELCSKYFLRVHKHNTHGIIEDGAPLPPQIAAKVNGEAAAAAAAAASAAAATASNPSPSMSSSSGQGMIQDQSDEVCPLCTRRFRSAKWLRAHLMSDHGKPGIDRLKELENLTKDNPSPTLKIPNGSFPGMLNSVFVGESDPMKQFAAMHPAALLAAEVDDSNNNNNSHRNSNGGKLKEYQCSFCSFSTPYYAFLFIHERSHSLMNPASAMNSAILRNASPMLPNAIATGLLNEFGQFKDNSRGSVAHQPFASQSESAVSIAKDMFPIGLGQPTAASITPSSTPASTPGMGGGMAEGNEKNNTDDEDLPQPPKKKSRSSRVVEGPAGVCTENFLRKLSMTGDSIPMGKLSKSESSHMLKDMANLTKRPAIYALPKEKDSEPMIMQSFLLEETMRGSSREKRKLNDIEEAENRKRYLPEDALALVMSNNNDVNGDFRKGEDSEMRNRFVPAVVFLPVRERISTPVTISFTLTPA